MASWAKVFSKGQQAFVAKGLELQDFDMFATGVSFSGKKPVFFMLQNQVYYLEKTSWKCLYVKLISIFYTYRSMSVKMAIRHYLSGVRAELKKPEKIAPHMHLETGVSISTAVKNISLAMQACRLNKNHFHLACCIKADDEVSPPLQVAPGEDSPSGDEIFSLKNHDASDYILIDLNKHYTNVAPVSFSYRGDVYPVDDWNFLYKGIIISVCLGYPALARANLTSRKIISKNPSDFMESDCILDDLFLAINRGPDAVLTDVKLALDLCGIPYEEFSIRCYKINQNEEAVSISNESALEKNATVENENTLSESDLVKDVDGEVVAEVFANEQTEITTATENEKQPHVVEVDSIESLKKNLPVRLSERYAYILSEFFADDGYKLGSRINRDRFESYYNDTFREDLPQTMVVVEFSLRNCGEVRDDRVFPSNLDSNNTLVESIISDIKRAFDEGTNAVYIEAVFSKYQGLLASQLHVYDQEEMAGLIIRNAKNKFFRRYSFFCVVDGKADSAQDVKRIMKSSYVPLTYDEIHERVWYIPYDKMKQLLVNDKSIVWVATETYFYAPNMPAANAEDLKAISNVIDHELQVSPFVLDEDLRRIIEDKLPTISMNLQFLSAKGLFSCLSYLLKDSFSFKRTMVSKLNTSFNLKEAFVDFVKMRELITFTDLKDFSEEMNSSTIYWNEILNEVIRISDSEMVKKSSIPFDIEAIDDYLESICSGEYMALKDVNLYLHFPSIGYAWNEFILEGYLYCFSKRFKLIHVSFANTSVTGAIVRVDSRIESYSDLLVDFLSKSKELSSTQAALQLIVDCGFQQRKRLDGIETIMQNAIALRNARLKD